jgi:hypothetical protein
MAIQYRKLTKLLIPKYRRYYRYCDISLMNKGRTWSMDYLLAESCLTHEQKLIMFYMIRGQGTHYIGNQLNAYYSCSGPFNHMIVEEMAWQALRKCALRRHEYGFVADFWNPAWPLDRDDYVPSKAKSKQVLTSEAV